MNSPPPYRNLRKASRFSPARLWTLAWAAFATANMAASLYALNITGSSNSETITSITVIDDGVTIIQNSPSSADDNDSTPALLEFVDIAASGGTRLDEFNTGVVTAVTLNFTASSGFNAYVGNSTINSSSPSFSAAVKTVYSNRNLRDYMDKAASANSNNPNGDYDIFYQYALSNDDYIVMSERDGNSTISLQALDSSGNVISGSQTLVFQGGSAFTWDTGYRSSEDNNNNQTQELCVVDISLFGTSTNIFGLRVINNSGADNKIFIASDDEFENNVPNPNGSQLPILTVVKYAEVDDGNIDAGDDFYVPGAEILYRVAVTNSGEGSPDPGSFSFTDDLPDEVELFVGNFSGGAPIRFEDGSEPSNLGFNASNIVYRNASGTAISPGSSGYNDSVRSIEIPFSSTFEAWDGSGPQPSFEIEYRVRLK